MLKPILRTTRLLALACGLSSTLVFVSAVREVEPEHIHAFADEHAEPLVGVGRGANGCAAVDKRRGAGAGPQQADIPVIAPRPGHRWLAGGLRAARRLG